MIGQLLINLKIEDLRVIGQSADKKIILCYHSKKRRIICFDQHAVDERIRYEKILKILNYPKDSDQAKAQACHGAIRVGDKLTLGMCHRMIKQLLECNFPYRCAHARRNVCVLESLDRTIYLEKMKGRFIDVERGNTG